MRTRRHKKERSRVKRAERDMHLLRAYRDTLEAKLNAVRDHAAALGYRTVVGMIDCPDNEPTHDGECAVCDCDVLFGTAVHR